ncbi:CMRF35-like molecule 3 [Esox lucius]|uniref:CMRF35-like molecule 3 n=1 Tax=Esox lucius TaxID=8010 RepID=UPI001477007A|nr:CMRF35-like molecule 3 [Esox lucius]
MGAKDGGEYLDVQIGGSITIPCHYDQKYIHYVKYWCKGFWDFCKYAARTDKTMGTKTSISDDLIRRVFTVTMTDLTPADSDYYWCAVEINKGPDIRIQRFYLSVTGAPRLYVEQQQVTGVEGGSATVCCYYSNTGDVAWCRVGVPCVWYSGTLDGALGRLNLAMDAKNRKVLTVTMSDLKMEDAGWYWCSVGDLQIPVQITVKPHSVTTLSTTTNHKTHSPDNPQTSSSSTSGPVLNTSHHTNSSSGPVEDNATQEVEGRKQKKYHQRLSLTLFTSCCLPSIRLDDLKILLIPLVILLVLIAGVLVAWKMWRKHG